MIAERHFKEPNLDRAIRYLKDPNVVLLDTETAFKEPLLPLDPGSIINLDTCQLKCAWDRVNFRVVGIMRDKTIEDALYLIKIGEDK